MNAIELVPVDVAVEVRDECGDAERARRALADALAGARAPRRTTPTPQESANPTETTASHWSVTMHVARTAGGSSADARVVDDAGEVVAERTLRERSGRTCLPLAQAVGAWATLVLDAELTRARDEGGSPFGRRDGASIDLLGGNDGTRVNLGPLTNDAETLGEQARTSAAPKKTLELGSVVYLRNGLSATGGIAGGSPFVAIELERGWFLRPSLAFGRSTSPIALRASKVAVLSQFGARADVCRRWNGNYLDRRGVELDLCSGLDVSYLESDAAIVESRGLESATRLAFESSAGLRGELGAGLALEVRALVGVNTLRTALLDEGDAPLVTAAAELGVSVRLP